jgi:DNA-binding Lrp family transcriptional regulator
MITNKAERDVRNAKILELYLTGMGFKRIAKIVDLSATTVGDIVKSMGVTNMTRAVVPRGGWPAKEKKPVAAKKGTATDKEPGQWGQSEALRKNTYDQIWGLAWSPISSETFAEFINELTRTPAEYSRNGGVHWSPTNAELASRLRVPADLVDEWAVEGIDEPWEICVVRAYGRTGIVATTDEVRVPAIVVHRALARANSLEDAASVTGIPLAMLEHHLEVGAPAKTHGRAYLLMASEEYRALCPGGRLPQERAAADATIARMISEGATFDEIALEVGVETSSINTRIKKLGLSAARARKGGRQS